MNIRKTALTAFVAASALLSAQAFAHDDAWDDGYHDRPQAVQSGKPPSVAPKISRSRAASIAQKRFAGARVTDVDAEYCGSRRCYQVELADGRYDYEVWVDAQSGKILHTRKEADD